MISNEYAKSCVDEDESLSWKIYHNLVLYRWMNDYFNVFNWYGEWDELVLGIFCYIQNIHSNLRLNCQCLIAVIEVEILGPVRDGIIIHFQNFRIHYLTVENKQSCSCWYFGFNFLKVYRIEVVSWRDFKVIEGPPASVLKLFMNYNIFFNYYKRW